MDSRKRDRESLCGVIVPFATSGDERPTIIFCPGIVNPPERYRVLLESLAARLNLNVAAFCPPGIGARRDDVPGPAHPRQLALSILRSFGDAPTSGRIWLAHSWGSGVARYGAELDRKAIKLILLDPNLGHYLFRMPTAWEAPSGFRDRAELVAEYGKWGVSEEEINWHWWREQPDGTWSPNFNQRQIQRFSEALPKQDPVSQLGRITRKLPVFVGRTDELTVTGSNRWARLRKCAPHVRVINLRGIRHLLPPSEQSTVADVLAQRALSQ